MIDKKAITNQTITINLLLFFSSIKKEVIYHLFQIGCQMYIIFEEFE